MTTHYESFRRKLEKQEQERREYNLQKVKGLYKISRLFMACSRLYTEQAKKLEKKLLQK